MRWELDDRVMRMLFDEEFFVIYILCTYLPTYHLPYVHMRWSCVNKVFVEVLCDTVLFSFFPTKRTPPPPPPISTVSSRIRKSLFETVYTINRGIEYFHVVCQAKAAGLDSSGSIEDRMNKTYISQHGISFNFLVVHESSSLCFNHQIMRCRPVYLG